jgi:5-carboxymethyl-2-hydroxymuconate isomerase
LLGFNDGMPHLILDHSPNLDGLVDTGAVLEAARIAMVETGVFPLGGIRVRAHRATACVIADGNPAHAYCDVILRMGAGRPLDVRQAAGEHVFKALSQAFEPAFAKTTVALSFEIVEIHSDLTWKRNTIHTALGGKG